MKVKTYPICDTLGCDEDAAFIDCSDNYVCESCMELDLCENAYPDRTADDYETLILLNEEEILYEDAMIEIQLFIGTLNETQTKQFKNIMLNFIPNVKNIERFNVDVKNIFLNLKN